MKRTILALALLAGAAAPAQAQSPFRIKPYVGAFQPMLPMVSVADGRNPDVELRSAPAVGLELEAAPRALRWLHLYGGVTYTTPRLHLSRVMHTHPSNGSSVRSTLLIPTAGVILAPRIGRTPVRPTLRLGVGAKHYAFDLAERRDGVTDLTGDLGLGFATDGPGPASFSAEARWLPSRFDARNLPIATVGRNGQDQNDWMFQLALRLHP